MLEFSELPHQSPVFEPITSRNSCFLQTNFVCTTCPCPVISITALKIAVSIQTFSFLPGHKPSHLFLRVFRNSMKLWISSLLASLELSFVEHKYIVFPWGQQALSTVFIFLSAFIFSLCYNQRKPIYLPMLVKANPSGSVSCFVIYGLQWNETWVTHGACFTGKDILQ